MLSKAPTESANKNTEMRLPHTKTELPKWGASTRLPAISSAISTMPAVNTKILSAADFGKSHGRSSVVWLVKLLAARVATRSVLVFLAMDTCQGMKELNRLTD
jgi:hypothetical protein